jgi:hypothetical protein
MLFLMKFEIFFRRRESLSRILRIAVSFSLNTQNTRIFHFPFLVKNIKEEKSR